MAPSTVSTKAVLWYALHNDIQHRNRKRCAPAGSQCDISTGTVMEAKMPRVTPPRMNSRRREWP